MSDTSTTTGTSVGSIADSINGSFTDLAKLVTAASYVAGTAFAAAEILKFKGHKDNPTQIPLVTTLAGEAVAAAILLIETITSGSTTT